MPQQARSEDPPQPSPNPGPPRMFSDLSAADQLRVVEILRPGFQRVMARRAERKRIEALDTEHVRAA